MIRERGERLSSLLNCEGHALIVFLNDKLLLTYLQRLGKQSTCQKRLNIARFLTQSGVRDRQH